MNRAGISAARSARGADTWALVDGLTIYFCDPHRPCKPPTNENTSNILRRWLPEGTNLSVHSRPDLVIGGSSGLNRNNALHTHRILAMQTPSRNNDYTTTPRYASQTISQAA